MNESAYIASEAQEKCFRDLYSEIFGMKYSEWKEKYVDGNSLTSSDDSGIINTEGNDMTFITGASGAIPRKSRDRMDDHAELYYEEIRKRDSDIKAISENTEFSEDDIQKIKTHIFFNEYDLGDIEPERFAPDYDMSVSWQRLIDGKNIQEMDIVMLNHELMEYGLMNEKGLKYREAHDETEKLYDYTKYVKELDLKEGIK